MRYEDQHRQAIRIGLKRMLHRVSLGLVSRSAKVGSGLQRKPEDHTRHLLGNRLSESQEHLQARSWERLRERKQLQQKEVT